MLLRQQYWMVKGLQALYKELQACNGWRGPDPKELANGEPHIHHILESIGVVTESNQHDVPAIFKYNNNQQEKLPILRDTNHFWRNEDLSNDTNTSNLMTLSFPGCSDISDLTRAWTDEETKIWQTGQIPTPPDSDFDYSPSWDQSPGEGNLYTQLTPLLEEESHIPAHFGQRQDYFSFVVGHVHVGNEFQFLPDHASMSKQTLFSTVDLD